MRLQAVNASPPAESTSPIPRIVREDLSPEASELFAMHIWYVRRFPSGHVGAVGPPQKRIATSARTANPPTISVTRTRPFSAPSQPRQTGGRGLSNGQSHTYTPLAQPPPTTFPPVSPVAPSLTTSFSPPAQQVQDRAERSPVREGAGHRHERSRPSVVLGERPLKPSLPVALIESGR